MKTKKQIEIIFLSFISLILISIGLVIDYKTNRNTSSTVLEDKIAPNLLNVSIKSNNQNNLSYAEKGDNVIISFESDEELQFLPTVEINGKMIDVIKDNNMYQAIYHVKEQYEEDKLINFKIYNYGDMFANMGKDIDNTSDLSKVYIRAKNKKVEKIKIESLNVNKSDLSLLSGEKFEIIIDIKPENAVYDDVKWNSSNKKVAIVNNGVIEALTPGYAEISVNIENLIKRIKVTVVNEKVKVTSIKLKDSPEIMGVGDFLKLEPVVSPTNANAFDIKWLSSNNNIATVEDGKVIAKKAGEVFITAKIDDVSTNKKIIIKDKKIPVSSVNLNMTNKSITIGEKFKLKVNVSPSNATNQVITWTSSNTDVVDVKNGIVTGKKKGTAKVTVTVDGKSAEVTITVSEKIIKVNDVTLNKSSGTIYLNANALTTNLIAEVFPSNADNKKISWSSNNQSVATVNSSGLVTAISPGEATITVKTEDGNYTDTFKITVKKKIIIVIGASQVVRMNDYVTTYTSSLNNSYSKVNKTLNYVALGGSGFAYQAGDGWNNAQNIIRQYSSIKKYIDFYIFFPMAGNDIKKFTCNPNYPNHQFFISGNNQEIKNYAINYNNVISKIKSEAYNVDAYVVSVQPVVTKQSTSDNVVTNENANACKINYRSNEKYYNFNNSMKTIIDNSSYNLKFLSLFHYIMETNDKGTNFSYKVTYNTTDGVHWNKATTIYYVNLMLNEIGKL